MDFGLKGKRALVLASSQGLGRGIAEALAAEGVDVCLSGRTTAKLASAAESINALAGGRAHFETADMTDPGSAAVLHAAATQKLGGDIDILINNTGGPPPGSVIDPEADSWRALFDMMILRVIEMTNLCLPGMRAAGWGRIVTVTSQGVQQPIPNLGMSNTLRPALVGWSKSLSRDVALQGITTNVLLPGRIDTERIAVLDRANAEKTGKTIEEIRAASEAQIPMGRLGRVEEFAATAAFLCSNQASYITGSCVRVDGGAIAGI